MKKLVTKALGSYLNGMASVSPGLAAKHGFKIFCYPFRAPLKSFHKAFLNSSQKFSFSHEGLSLQVYRWGSGPKKLLFLHGWQSHSFRWKNYIQALSPEEYTIYALDAPGHGYSKGTFLTVPIYAAVIRRFIETTGSFDTVVSHSIGSFSVLYALYQQPALPIGRVVAMGCPANARSFIDFYKQSLQLSGRAAGLIEQHFEAVIRKPVDYFNAPRFAESVKVKGLIIHDTGDLEAPYSAALAIHRAWTGSKLITTQGLGHRLKSPEVVQMVIDYIQNKEYTAAGGKNLSGEQASLRVSNS